MARILIIDDDSDFREHLREALEAEGHEVSEAEDGLAGLCRYRQQPADLIIIDFLMPHQDGFTSIRALKDEFPGSKIVLLSAMTRAYDRGFLEGARAAGAIRSFSKPFNFLSFLGAIDELVAA